MDKEGDRNKDEAACVTSKGKTEDENLSSNNNTASNNNYNIKNNNNRPQKI